MREPLPPGRELDAKVAEAMGWTRIQHTNLKLSGDPHYYLEGVPPEPGMGYRIPHYSTTWEGVGLMLPYFRMHHLMIRLHQFADHSVVTVKSSDQTYYCTYAAPQLPGAVAIVLLACNAARKEPLCIHP